MSVVVLSAGRSFLISGSPSQQWTGTRSGVPRWKAMRVRSAVFTVDLLFLRNVFPACPTAAAGGRRISRRGLAPAGLDPEGAHHLRDDPGGLIWTSCRSTASTSCAWDSTRASIRLSLRAALENSMIISCIGLRAGWRGYRPAGDSARRMRERRATRSRTPRKPPASSRLSLMPASDAWSRSRSSSVRRSAARRTIASSITSRASIASVDSRSRPRAAGIAPVEKHCFDGHLERQLASPMYPAPEQDSIAIETSCHLTSFMLGTMIRY